MALCSKNLQNMIPQRVLFSPSFLGIFVFSNDRQFSVHKNNKTTAYGRLAGKPVFACTPVEVESKLHSPSLSSTFRNTNHSSRQRCYVHYLHSFSAQIISVIIKTKTGSIISVMQWPEKSRTAISPNWFDRLARHLARQHTLSLLTVTTVKILNFYMCKIVDGRYLKTTKIFICHFYATIQAAATKSRWMTRRPYLDPMNTRKF